MTGRGWAWEHCVWMKTSSEDFSVTETTGWWNCELAQVLSQAANVGPRLYFRGFCGSTLCRHSMDFLQEWDGHRWYKNTKPRCSKLIIVPNYNLSKESKPWKDGIRMLISENNGSTAGLPPFCVIGPVTERRSLYKCPPFSLNAPLLTPHHPSIAEPVESYSSSISLEYAVKFSFYCDFVGIIRRHPSRFECRCCGSYRTRWRSYVRGSRKHPIDYPWKKSSV